jgi:hypothetical protein
MNSSAVRDYYNGMVEYVSGVKPRHKYIFESLKKIVKPNMSVLDVGWNRGKH